MMEITLLTFGMTNQKTQIGILISPVVIPIQMAGVMQCSVLVTMMKIPTTPIGS
jgi:hypothetical protein